MPLLFCLAVHDALAGVKEQLQEGEVIFAFLDDVYALCSETDGFRLLGRRDSPRRRQTSR